MEVVCPAMTSPAAVLYHTEQTLLGNDQMMGHKPGIGRARRAASGPVVLPHSIDVDGPEYSFLAVPDATASVGLV
jgi:hypothetical protein